MFFLLLGKMTHNSRSIVRNFNNVTGKTGRAVRPNSISL